MTKFNEITLKSEILFLKKPPYLVTEQTMIENPMANGESRRFFLSKVVIRTVKTRIKVGMASDNMASNRISFQRLPYNQLPPNSDSG